MPGMQQKILSGQVKVRDADMHRLARADFPNRKQIVHEILHPEEPSRSAVELLTLLWNQLLRAGSRCPAIQQDFDSLTEDTCLSYRTIPTPKLKTLRRILKQHKAYMAQFEEMLNDEKIA